MLNKSTQYRLKRLDNNKKYGSADKLTEPYKKYIQKK